MKKRIQNGLRVDMADFKPKAWNSIQLLNDFEVYIEKYFAISSERPLASLVASKFQREKRIFWSTNTRYVENMNKMIWWFN